MSTYEIKCTIWVRGETPEAAIEELHGEVDYWFGLDNGLVALESGSAVQVESEDDENEED